MNIIKQVIDKITKRGEDPAGQHPSL